MTRASARGLDFLRVQAMIDAFTDCMTSINKRPQFLVAGKVLSQYLALQRVVTTELIGAECSLRFKSSVSNSQVIDVLRNSLALPG